MGLILGIIGVALFAIFVFGTLGLSSLFKRENNKQKKAELAKTRRQVKVYPGHDRYTDALVSAKGKTTAECINDTDQIIVYFELMDKDGYEVIEPVRFSVDDILDYIKIL